MTSEVSCRHREEGYVVEIALPFKQLRFQPGQDAQTWGFEAFRSWPRNVRHRLSSQRRDRNVACLLCQENKITGLAGLAPGRNVELDPTGTFSRTERRDPSSAPSLSPGTSTADAGLTARWSVAPSMTLNGALNPDFSQVEADVAQLDVNQRSRSSTRRSVRSSSRASTSSRRRCRRSSRARSPTPPSARS